MMALILTLSFIGKTLTFCGYNFDVFNNYDKLSGNYFSQNMVSLKNGVLELSCEAFKTDSGLVLYSAGVVSEKAFGYGTFVFIVKGPIHSLLYACFAPFLYDFSSGEYELDIEFSRWGNPVGHNGQFVATRLYGKWNAPDSVKRGFERFWFGLKGKNPLTKHIIHLLPDSVVFESFSLVGRRGKLIKRHVVKDKNLIPDKPINAEIYLWWPKNPGKPLKHTIRVLYFQYFPLSN